MRDSSQCTIVLADDLMLIREGLACLCESFNGYRVVGQAGDGAAALEMIEQLRPEIALLDLNLPQLLTVEIVKRLKQSGASSKVVILSIRGDRKTVLEALRAGAHGFVLKSSSARELHEAFQQVRDGCVYVSPVLKLENLFVARRGTSSDPVEKLSAREYQVFTMLVDGVRAKEIANRLTLSPKTVDTYRASLMRKLDIHDIAGLVKFSLERNQASSARAIAGGM